MSRIDEPRRLNIDEFPKETRETMERLSEYYNYFVEQVTNNINGNIDYDNLKHKLIELTFSTDTSGQPTPILKFSQDVGLVGTSVVRVDNLTNSTIPPESHPFISYSTAGNGVYTVTNITGLRASTKYRIVIELKYS
jgi:hypothetical protein